jgi:predicted DNA-binding transcriptional regulator AlpA
MTSSQTLPNIGSSRLWPMEMVQVALGGCHRTTVYNLIKRNAFPKPVKLGGASWWIADEIQNWMKERMAAR